MSLTSQMLRTIAFVTPWMLTHNRLRMATATFASAPRLACLVGHAREPAAESEAHFASLWFRV